jgi:DNA-binding transcriptional ArsR family regulator
MTETWDDVNEQVKADWKDDTTPFERVYEIVEQTHDGQSAAEIADRALVSEPTARRHCKSLVKTGFAETEQDGQTTLYKRNSDRVLMSRIRELREEVTRPELLDSIYKRRRPRRRVRAGLRRARVDEEGLGGGFNRYLRVESGLRPVPVSDFLLNTPPS